MINSSMLIRVRCDGAHEHPEKERQKKTLIFCSAFGTPFDSTGNGFDCVKIFIFLHYFTRQKCVMYHTIFYTIVMLLLLSAYYILSIYNLPVWTSFKNGGKCRLIKQGFLYVYFFGKRSMLCSTNVITKQCAIFSKKTEGND